MSKQNPHLILASGSKFRKELLNKLKLPFSVVVPDCDETPLKGETPEDLVLRLSRLKAKTVAQKHPDALVIGSDEMAAFAGKAIGKPKNADNARKQLLAMSGQSVTFLTGLCLYSENHALDETTYVTTAVKFRPLHQAIIDRYLTLDEPFHCAASFKFESLGISLIESFTGPDPNALIGLPLIELVNMLERAGVLY